MISQQNAPSTPNPDASWRESLSALVDGECRADELAAVLQVGAGQAALRAAWDEYLVVGAALRGASGRAAMPARGDFVAAVMEQLASEPQPLPADVAVAEQVERSGVAANDALWRWKLVAGVAAVTALTSLAWQFGNGAGAAPAIARWNQAAPGAEPGPDVVLGASRASGAAGVVPALATSLERH
ncbi:MAG: hypothetical protein RJA36_3787 [Pseudomonadota bacterium]|jgi:sigma-E factor negative regulatory protein RseA